MCSRYPGFIMRQAVVGGNPLRDVSRRQLSALEDKTTIAEAAVIATS
jgi:hypothetical protein